MTRRRWVQGALAAGAALGLVLVPASAEAAVPRTITQTVYFTRSCHAGNLTGTQAASVTRTRKYYMAGRRLAHKDSTAVSVTFALTLPGKYGPEPATTGHGYVTAGILKGGGEIVKNPELPPSASRISTSASLSYWLVVVSTDGGTTTDAGDCSVDHTWPAAPAPSR